MYIIVKARSTYASTIPRDQKNQIPEFKKTSKDRSKLLGVVLASKHVGTDGRFSYRTKYSQETLKGVLKLLRISCQLEAEIL